MTAPVEKNDALYPVLPLRDIVVFPHMIIPLFVGREKSVAALEAVMATKSKIFLATQKEAGEENPSIKGLYKVGVLGTILQMLKLPDGTVKVLIEGAERVHVTAYKEGAKFFEAGVEPFHETVDNFEETEALARAVISQFESYLKLNKKIPPEIFAAISQIQDHSKLADSVAAHVSAKIVEKQEVLQTSSIAERLKLLFAMMEGEISVLQVEKRIRNRVKRQMEKTQRDYYLNEQMRAIQKELGDGEDGKDEILEIEKRIKKTKLSPEARERAESEVKKLKNMSPMSAEATVIRNYLDWLLNIPWGHGKPLKIDLAEALRILNEDHFGLEKVKERILEFLAVQERVKKIKGSILCLVGPPGVGKTSLGKSIARATGRSFVRMSLGGVRDEAEIRGHRRTYIGALPGKIVQGMKKAKHTNPLFLLDEIDKMANDWRGDPASALLEVLDPEQNNTFNDHYLEVDYDLSDVMFVTTANSLNMAGPLLDRMEIIRISGYTEDEKVEITKRHLLPRIFENNGLKPKEFSIDDDAIRHVIRYYTRESGVRNLEREISNIARKSLKDILSGVFKKVHIDSEKAEHYLGVRKTDYGRAEQEDMIGVVTGLAWTESGGDLLSIEAVGIPGKGKMTITGNLSQVMQESVQAAVSFVNSRAPEFGIEPPLFEKTNIHVHVPEGATPKDGPSAGIAMATAIVSMLTGIAVSKDVAMTGEITLRGRVLPIGGLKEKLLAAHRGGIKKVVIPFENSKDLADIPDNVKNNLEIVPVKWVSDVFPHALVRPLVAIEWNPADHPKAVPVLDEDDADHQLKH